MLTQGILLGFTLSFMVGPLLFAIVQAGIERGFRAGLAVASGIWVGDVLYVLLLRYGVETLSALTALPNFRLWAGICGGLLLVAFGIGSLLGRKKPIRAPRLIEAEHLLDVLHESDKPTARRHWTTLGLPGYWMRGFLMNLINPFTVFFWLGIASAVVIPNNWSGRETTLFFGGMLGTLILTDIFKAYAAKRLGKWLTGKHIRWMKQGIGLLLLVFGIALIVRVL